MTSGFNFGEEEARRVEAIYFTPDAIKRRQIVRRNLELKPGESVLDIGTGPGFVALEMAEEVGPSGSVLGIDRSQPMLELAARRCADVSWVSFRPGEATSLPCDDASFDVAVSVQVYEYVSDIKVALAEMFRVLKPGGRAAIVATDWDSILWHASDTTRMARVLSAWEEHLDDSRLPRTLTPLLKSAGFEVGHREVIVQFNPDYSEDTYSVRLLPLMADFVAGRRGVTAEDATAWLEDLRGLGERDEYFFCLNQYLFMSTKPSG
jgi:ubiquinone/menaquinone biosynthesis C-methylase UbiE